MIEDRDLELLRRYEPILRFTQGEMFFPTRVEPYVERCSFWMRSGRRASEVVKAGDLDIDKLAALPQARPGESQWLQFVDAPLSGLALWDWKSKEREEFRAPGRLARVGLLARFVDGLFTISLYLRGTVPGGTAARAEIQYREMFEAQPVFSYYGRVVRDSQYIALQYLFFYAMNDWRSSFYGVNDHEADWEQIFVYLDNRPGGEPTPAWVAYASHDAFGDDLRRHWDDPELHREGEHPVVFPGAGSHASYFRPGEYLVEVNLRPLEPMFRALRAIGYVWRNLLRQGDPQAWTARAERFFRVPFVDYARGDGLSVGPGQAETWYPVCIDDETPWVRNYRGLWGLDVQDIFAGELAPAGPRYGRDGRVRDAWRDPIGWSGLRKVASDAHAREMLDERIEALETEIETLSAAIAELDHTLPRMELELRALRQGAYLRPMRQRREAEIVEMETERTELGRRRSELRETLEAARRLQEGPSDEIRGDLRQHLRRVHEPETPQEQRRNIAAEVWAAISTGLLLVGGVLLIVLGGDVFPVTGGILIAAVILVESLFRRTLTRLLGAVVLVLTIVTGLVLLYEFFWQITLALVALIGLLIIIDNIRELRGR